jgi:hypothetical protein
MPNISQILGSTQRHVVSVGYYIDFIFKKWNPISNKI